MQNRPMRTGWMLNFWILMRIRTMRIRWIKIAQEARKIFQKYKRMAIRFEPELLTLPDKQEASLTDVIF